jgi:hypothetical protein
MGIGTGLWIWRNKMSERETPLDRFNRAGQVYADAWQGSAPLTPELATNFYQKMWEYKTLRAGLIDHKVEVPPYEGSQKKLTTLRKENRGVVFVPDEFMREEHRENLEYMFPFDIWEDDARGDMRGGWVDVEMDGKPPYTNLSADEQNVLISDMGRTGQRWQTNVIASWVSGLITGESFDRRGTESRLLGSVDSVREKTLVSFYDSPRIEGLLVMRDHSSDRKLSNAGARSEGR